MIVNKPKMLIITTIPLTLIFFKGQISYLKSEYDIELVSSSGEYLEQISKVEKVKSHVVEINREIKIIKDLKSLFNLIFLFKKIKPNIIHSNTPKASLLTMIAGYITNVPVRIYYVHGFKFHAFSGFRRFYLVMFEKITCYFATNVIAVSQGVKDELVNINIQKDKVGMIHNGSINGIDLSYYSSNNSEIQCLKKEFNILETDFVYGFVGRLVRDKGISELLTAFLKINETQTNVKLLIVGMFDNDDSNFTNEVNTIISNNKNIIFAGFQKDVRPFYKMMNALVFPSYREGFGMAVLESSAMNVPVISSDIIGCNEIIKNYETGVLVPVKSVSEIYKAMMLIKTDNFFYNKLKNNCRDFVSSRYDQKIVWQETKELLSKIKLNKESINVN
jgi:glycosyltransferase involved in cell wall biosynthesis